MRIWITLKTALPAELPTWSSKEGEQQVEAAAPAGIFGRRSVAFLFVGADSCCLQGSMSTVLKIFAVRGCRQQKRTAYAVLCPGILRSAAAGFQGIHRRIGGLADVFSRGIGEIAASAVVRLVFCIIVIKTLGNDKL